MLNDANLEKIFWAEAITTANYLQNRIITSATNKTPYEMYYKKRPQVKSLAVFGSRCYVKIPNHQRHKLENSAKEMILFGFDEHNSTIYRCYDTETKKIVISRDVNFNIPENKVQNGMDIYFNGQQSIHPDIDPDSIDFPDDADEGLSSDDNDSSNSSSSNENNSNNSSSSSTNDQPTIRISARITKGKHPIRLGYDENFEQINAIVEPKNLNDVLHDPYKDEWLEAMRDEMDSMHKNKTWELVELPPDRKAIGNKWVFTVKTNFNGEIEKFKARFVAQGFSQKFGVDYDEIFAPVVNKTTFRILLSIASRMKLKVHQFDVKTAFLNGVIQETIYMKQPPGFVVKGQEHLVCSLKRSIYGLKQAANSWNEAINEILLTFGFKRSTTDNCLYFKRFDDGNWCIILIYVDDILITATDENIVNQVQKDISSTFEIKSLGEIKNYLGIEVERRDGTYYIKQEKYIKKIAEEFGLNDAKISKIPIDPGYEREQQNNVSYLQSNKKYQKIIGSLLYVAINTRPDIAACVSILAQKTSKPTEYDWNEAKRVIRYLKGTANLQLQLESKDAQNEIIGHADANWAESRIDRKSNSGYIFKLFGGTISWRSKKQECVALSSTEVELISLTDAVKEAIWIRRMLKEIQQNIKDLVVIYEDNQSCRKMIQKTNPSSRTKHIDVRYYFIKDYIKKKIISCEYCSTENMVADILTKPLNRTKFEKFRLMLGLV